MRKKVLKSKHVTIRMQDDMFDKLNKQSIFYDVSIGTIIRKALNEYFDTQYVGDIMEETIKELTDGK